MVNKNINEMSPETAVIIWRVIFVASTIFTIYAGWQAEFFKGKIDRKENREDLKATEQIITKSQVESEENIKKHIDQKLDELGRKLAPLSDELPEKNNIKAQFTIITNNSDPESANKDLTVLLNLPEIDTVSKITLLFEMARNYQKLFEFDKGIDTYKQVISLAEELKEGEKILVQRDALINMGIIQLDKGQVDDGILSFTKAETLSINLKDTVGEAIAIMDKGVAHDMNSRFDVAFRLNEKAISIFRKFGVKELLCKSLINQGIVQRNSGRIAESNIFFNESIDIATNSNLGRLLAEAQLNLGIAMRLERKFDDAVKYFNTSKKYFERIRDIRLGTINGNLGLIAFEKGNWLEAHDFHKKALSQFELFNDKLGIGNESTNLGNTLARIGDFNQAKSFVETGIEVHESIGNRYGAGNSYAVLGTIYVNQGQNLEDKKLVKTGISYLSKAREIYIQIGNQARVVMVDKILNDFK